MVYSDSFKARVVEKMVLGRSACALSREVGVPQPTLSRWLKEARSVAGVTPKKKPPEARAPRRPQDWKAEEKLAAVREAAGLDGEQLGEFLRSRGLHDADLAEWRRLADAGALEALAGQPTSGGPAGRRVKELERELRRKEKALAEASALLLLSKKAEALWGEEDATTGKKSDEKSSR